MLPLQYSTRFLVQEQGNPQLVFVRLTRKPAEVAQQGLHATSTSRAVDATTLRATGRV